MTQKKLFTQSVLVLGAVAAIGISLYGQAPQRAAAPAVFTAAQATAGQSAYQANCASCHLADLAGQNEAPQLAQFA